MADQAIARMDDLRARIERAWDALETQVAAYPEDVLTGPSGEAGWSIKDHLAHLTAWEAGVVGIIRDGVTQDVTMSVDRAVWDAGDLDAVNERIRVQTADAPLAEVLAARQATHRELLAALRTLTAERLGERWTDGTGDAQDAPTILQKVTGNTVEHYPEHAQWIAAIPAGASS